MVKNVLSELDERDNERVCNEVPRSFLKGEKAGGCEDNGVTAATAVEDEVETVRTDTCDEASECEDDDVEDIDGDSDNDDEDDKENEI